MTTLRAAVNWSDVDKAIRQGDAAFEIWRFFGRNLGLTLEDIVMRKQDLRFEAQRKAKRRHKRRSRSPFQGKPVTHAQLDLIPA